MEALRDRPRNSTPTENASARPRPVMLATLSVRIDPSAERMACESALDAGVPLIIANMLTLPPYPLTMMLAREREPGLLVFGPDLRSISRWRFRRVAQRVRDEIGCLVWIAPDG